MLQQLYRETKERSIENPRVKELDSAFARPPHQATQGGDDLVRMSHARLPAGACGIGANVQPRRDFFTVYELSRTESVASEAAVLVGVLLPGPEAARTAAGGIGGAGGHGGRAGGRTADAAPRGPRRHLLSGPRQGRGA